jgi:flagellar hook-length control protein FliK
MREATPAVHSPPERPRPSGRRDHPADGPPDLFAAVLASTAGPPQQAKTADTKARTAHAEGDRAGCDSTGQTESQTAPPSAPATPPATADAVQAPVAAPAAPANTPAAGQVEPPAAPAQATQPVVPGALPATTAPVATEAADHAVAPPPEQPQQDQTAATVQPTVVAQPTQAAEAAPATVAETAATPQAPAQADQPAAAKQQPTAAPAGGAAAAAPKAAGGHAQHHEDQGQERHRPQTAATAEPAAAAGRRVRVRSGQHRPEPIASTRTQQTVSPTTAQAEGAAPASETWETTHAAAPAQARVRILELAESMRAVVSVAKGRGSATARITLRPETLGGVQVKLRAGRDGVSAELVADSAHAAQALATAGGDLRRALEAQGVNLLGLDVRTAGDGTEAHGHEGRRAAESELMGGQGGTDAGEDPETTIEPSRLPDPGSQVDVLA